MLFLTVTTKALSSASQSGRQLVPATSSSLTTNLRSHSMTATRAGGAASGAKNETHSRSVRVQFKDDHDQENKAQPASATSPATIRSTGHRDAAALDAAVPHPAERSIRSVWGQSGPTGHSGGRAVQQVSLGPSGPGAERSNRSGVHRHL